LRAVWGDPSGFEFRAAHSHSNSNLRREGIGTAPRGPEVLTGTGCSAHAQLPAVGQQEQ